MARADLAAAHSELNAARNKLATARSEIEKAVEASGVARGDVEAALAAAAEARLALEKLSSGLYSTGVRRFTAGELDAAEAVFACYLEAVGQSDLLEKRATNDLPRARDYASFEPMFHNFLANRQKAWQAKNVPLPPFSREVGNHQEKRNALAGTTAFFIFPQYIFNSRQYIECDIKDHLYESALNAGVRGEYFYGDNILYPHLSLDSGRAGADLTTLRERIDSLRPDVIVFDANFVGENVGLNADYLRMLKEEYGARLIGFMGDVWGTHWIEIANYWGAVADMIIYIVPEGPFIKACAVSDKMLSTPYPVNGRNFFFDSARKFDLSFFGSYAYLRPFWLTHVLRTANRLNLKVNVKEHERTNDCPSLTDYARILRRSRMVLNFSSRNTEAKIITGRVWQTLNSGSLLLEEENDQTRHFFVPFVHYVPFENAVQLEYLIEFFHKNPNLADMIGQSARAFCVEHYDASTIWARILDAPQLHSGLSR